MHVCTCGSRDSHVSAVSVVVCVAECLYSRRRFGYLYAIKIGIMLVWVIGASSAEKCIAEAEAGAAANVPAPLNITRNTWCDYTQAFAYNNKNCVYNRAHLMFHACE